MSVENHHIVTRSAADHVVTRRAPAVTSFDPKTRRFRATAATATPVRRRDWMSGEAIDEVLVISPAAIDLSRAKGGVMPILDAHRVGSVRDQLGRVVDAWIEGGELVIEGELSERADLADLAADLAAGIVRGVSIAYRIDESEVVRGRDGEPSTVRVTKWVPSEVSIVTVPADPNARVRAHEGGTGMPPKVITTEDDTHSPPIAPEAPADPGTPRTRAFTPEQRRDLAARAGLGDDFASRNADLDETSYRAALFDGMVARQVRIEPHVRVGNDMVTDGLNAVEGALYARISGQPAQGAAARLASRSLVDLGAEVLRARGVDLGFGSAYEVARRAMHTTSDFPILLGNVLYRRLLDLFKAAESGASMIAAPGTTRDFRPVTEVRMSSFPELVPLGESGEIKFGTLDETGEVLRIASFARGISVSFQTVVNDDLNGVDRSVRDIGFAAAELKAKLIIAALSAPLADGYSLFHALHGNLAAAGAHLGVDSLSKGRLAMREQKAIGGTVPLGLAPRILLVPSALETAAEVINAAITPPDASSVNPFAGKLTIAVEPRLTDAIAWYLFTDPSVYAAVKFLTLDGFSSPRLEMENQFEKLGTSYRVHWHCGAGPVDFRGAYKNPGAEGGYAWGNL